MDLAPGVLRYPGLNRIGLAGQPNLPVRFAISTGRFHHRSPESERVSCSALQAGSARLRGRGDKGRAVDRRDAAVRWTPAFFTPSPGRARCHPQLMAAA